MGVGGLGGVSVSISLTIRISILQILEEFQPESYV